MDFMLLQDKVRQAALIRDRHGEQSLARWLSKQEEGDLILETMLAVA